MYCDDGQFIPLPWPRSSCGFCFLHTGTVMYQEHELGEQFARFVFFIRYRSHVYILKAHQNIA